MIYILIALKAEAQAFVDKYKLINYKNKSICVVLSGIGADNMYKATLHVSKNMQKNDKLLNVGICAASKKYKIGQLINGFKDEITCLDFEVHDKNKYNIVDMESAGFLKASLHVEQKYMYKIVSDHFEPKSVSKDKAKKLIFDKIDEIMEKIK